MKFILVFIGVFFCFCFAWLETRWSCITYVKMSSLFSFRTAWWVFNRLIYISGLFWTQNRYAVCCYILLLMTSREGQSLPKWPLYYNPKVKTNHTQSSLLSIFCIRESGQDWYFCRRRVETKYQLTVIFWTKRNTS